MTTLAEASAILRGAWSAGGSTYGAWCSIPDSFAAEIMGSVGYDWACIDLQHGLAGPDTVVPMMQALSVTGTPTFLRVPWNAPEAIMRALDLGAVGVIVPMIESAAEASAAVRACRYAPAGSRSYGPTRAALRSGESPTDQVNGDIICAVMVETVTALDALDEILSVPGVNVVFVGPADLRISMGARDVADPAFLGQLTRIADRARAHGVVAGIFCPSDALAVAWRGLGYQMLAVASDVRLLRQAASESLRGARDQRQEVHDDQSRSGYL